MIYRLVLVIIVMVAFVGSFVPTEVESQGPFEIPGFRVPEPQLCIGRPPGCGCGVTSACIAGQWRCIFPEEVCNGRDDDCDGLIDEGDNSLCDDGLSCTEDLCTEIIGGGFSPSSGRFEVPEFNVGCVHNPVHSICDDGARCTVDLCAPQGEFGFSGPDIRGCVSRVRHEFCDDKCDCTGVETCDPVRAGVTPFTPGTGCVDGVAECNFDGDMCTGEPCCESSAECLARMPPELRSFQEGACETFEEFGIGRTITSRSGAQIFCPDFSTPLNCDDGNPCTRDSCDPASGCLHSNVDDGTFIGLQDLGCTRKVCINGQVHFEKNTDQESISCEFTIEGRHCRDNTCSPLVPPNPLAVPLTLGTRWTCRSPAESTLRGRCSDGVFCNGEERCLPYPFVFGPAVPGFVPSMQGCAPGEPINCDDGLSCNTDTCDEVNDRCINTPCPEPF